MSQLTATTINFGTSMLRAGPHISGEQTWERVEDLLPEGVPEGIFHTNYMSLLQATDFNQLDCVVFPKLKEFVLSGRGETEYSEYEVLALSRLMPNLTTLMLGMDNDGFWAACEGWKQMEVLIVQPYHVDVSGLTGNSPLLDHRLPNLSDLTNLRYFGMGFETSRPRENVETDLTDESVINAILPLRNLEDITAVYDRKKITAEIRDQLLSKFPCSRIHEDGNDVQEWPFVNY